MNALQTQEGGNHYKDMKIQPMEYILANDLGFCEGNVIKYVSRWRRKNGIEDLKKAIHNLEILIEYETRRKGQDKPTVGQTIPATTVVVQERKRDSYKD